MQEQSRGPDAGKSRVKMPTPAWLDKHLADIHPHYDDRIRQRAHLIGWELAIDEARGTQKDDGVIEDDAREARKRHIEQRKAKANKEIVEPDHIDVDSAFRRLFPWASPEITVAPSSWGPDFAPVGSEIPKAHQAAIDARVEMMYRQPGKYGRPRADADTMGFSDLFLVARAGVFRAVVAASWARERYEQRQGDDGVIPRLKALAEKSNRLSIKVGLLAGELAWRDFNPVGRNDARPSLGPIVEEMPQGRLRRFIELVELANTASDNLLDLAVFCDVTAESFVPPKEHVWSRTFAEVLAETWRELTGELPAARSPRFVEFVRAAYLSIKFDESGDATDPYQWDQAARDGVERLRKRAGFSPTAWQSQIGSRSAQPLDEEHISRDIFRRLLVARAAYPDLYDRLSEILYLEDRRRRDPEIRPALEALLCFRNAPGPSEPKKLPPPKNGKKKLSRHATPPAGASPK